MQIDALQYVAAFRIAEKDILKGDLAFQLFRAVVCLPGIKHFGGLVEYFLDAFSAGCAVACQRGELREITHRLVEHVEIGEEEDQRSHVDGGRADGDKAEAKLKP